MGTGKIKGRDTDSVLPETDGENLPLEITGAGEGEKVFFFLAFGAVLIAAAFLLDSAQSIAKGSWRILISTANLVTDYVALGGPGAALLNAGIMTCLSLGLVKAARAKVSGSVAAALFTVAGFSLFGKNLYNSMPIVAGVYFYSKVVRIPFDRFLLQSLFGTALAPLVSEVTFGLGLSLPAGIILGVLAGMVSGFLLPPLSAHFLRFHQGFSLYNIGFTSGIVGLFFLAVLKGFGIDVTVVSLVSSGRNEAFCCVLLPMFSVMLLMGILSSGRKTLAGLRILFAQSGRLPADFVVAAGTGPTMVNMALLGFLSTAYVLLVGGELNGPVIGGIFTVVGFGAFGKHVRNIIPIVLGVFLANQFFIHDSNSTGAILGALFGTTLAPIAGQYGVINGIVAGVLHMAVVGNIGYLHGGMNLYNNGFSGGFIAAAYVPLLDAMRKVRDKD